MSPKATKAARGDGLGQTAPILSPISHAGDGSTGAGVSLANGPKKRAAERPILTVIGQPGSAHPARQHSGGSGGAGD